MRFRFRTTVLVLSLLAAIGAVATSQALAGPNWWHRVSEKAAFTSLANGQTQQIKSKGEGFKIEGASGTKVVECLKKVKDEGSITGYSTQGKDFEKITLEECKVNGHPECTVGPLGLIRIENNTKLVALGANFGDAFEPKSGTKLFEYELRGSSCPAELLGTYVVEGTLVGLFSVSSGRELELEFTSPAQSGTSLTMTKGGVGQAEPKVVGKLSISADNGEELDVK